MTLTGDSTRNGVDTAALFATLDAVRADPGIAAFQFRASNTWVSGTHNRSTIHDFHGATQELTHREPTTLDADHPAVLVGGDSGPTPVEYLLHALAACLTSELANIAAARGGRGRREKSRIGGEPRGAVLRFSGCADRSTMSLLHPASAGLAAADRAAPVSAPAGVRPRTRASIDPELVAFCDANHDRIVGLMAALVADHHVAEDLAQEAFLRCHTNWRRLRHMADREAWLRRVAVNLANSWWRRRYSELRANRRHSSGRPEAATPETAHRMAVRAAVASLPKRQRTVIALRYFGGLSVAETAEVMRCREGTVKSLTAKAMASLRDRIGREAVGTATEGIRTTWSGSWEEGDHAGHR